MERADRTGTDTDWRQGWRDFANRVSRPAGARNGLEPVAVPVQTDESREDKFQGFGSPPGKF